jgi:hypothetical protein
MKKFLLIFITITIIFALPIDSSARRDHSVSGYYRSNGTYVQPYRRTNRDYTRNNNYSTRGNINPYTLRPGTKPRDYEYYPRRYSRSRKSPW